MPDGLNILVVDDDLSILEVMGEYLREQGHMVETRNNGREALDALRDSEFALVISDGKMAGMDGFEFVQVARRNYPDLAIILMTAHESEYPLSESLRAGADGYVTKPFSLKKFSLIFNEEYWRALGRDDWWDAHGAKARGQQGDF